MVPCCCISFAFSINGLWNNTTVYYEYSSALEWDRVSTYKKWAEYYLRIVSSLVQEGVEVPGKRHERLHIIRSSSHTHRTINIPNTRLQESYVNQQATTLPPTSVAVYVSQHPRFTEKTNRQHCHHVQYRQLEDSDRFKYRQISRKKFHGAPWPNRNDGKSFDYYPMPTPRRVNFGQDGGG